METLLDALREAIRLLFNLDPALLNPYGVIPVNPDKSANINGELAEMFVQWITSAAVQEQIGAYGVDTFGQPLFYPNATAE